jgi:hypothetical protein
VTVLIELAISSEQASACFLEGTREQIDAWIVKHKEYRLIAQNQPLYSTAIMLAGDNLVQLNKGE